MNSSTKEKVSSSILFLSYYYPPIHSIATKRNHNISINCQKYFYKVFVFTTKNSRFLAKNTENTEGVILESIFTFDYRTLAYWFSRKEQKESTHFSEQTKQNPFIQFFAVRLLNSFPFNLLFHEGGIIYTLICFFKAVRLIKKENITHIYSSFRPYSDHFTAYLLKIFFPKLFWIADFRDLHIEPQYRYVVFEPFQHWCNKQILKKANIVTTVADGLAKNLTRYTSKVKVLRNSIDSKDLIFEKKPFERFTISYTGSMYGDTYRFEILLEIIQKLINLNILNKDNFQILYAGKDTHTWLQWINRFGLTDYFESKGSISLTDAINIQRNSHLNLVFATAKPESTGQLSGKLYEYFAAKNPIIVLIEGIQDLEFETIMDELNAGIVVYNHRSHSELEAFVLEKFNQWKDIGDVKSTINIEKLNEYSWEYQVQKFIEYINL
jgi:hypothetical protein